MTFECGRNQRASVLLGDVDASADHDGPAPADITKLAREITHAGLHLALEFYDEDHCEASGLSTACGSGSPPLSAMASALSCFHAGVARNPR